MENSTKSSRPQTISWQCPSQPLSSSSKGDKVPKSPGFPQSRQEDAHPILSYMPWPNSRGGKNTATDGKYATAQAQPCPFWGNPSHPKEENLVLHVTLSLLLAPPFVVAGGGPDRSMHQSAGFSVMHITHFVTHNERAA